MPIEWRIVGAPFPSAMQMNQTTHDVSLGRGLLKHRLVDAIHECIGVIANGPDGLAMDDNTSLQELELGQVGMLPCKPQTKIFMNVLCLIDTSLKGHDYVRH